MEGKKVVGRQRMMMSDYWLMDEGVALHTRKSRKRDMQGTDECRH